MSSMKPIAPPPDRERQWTGLRRYTPARIALGRVGASLPTDEVLRFSMEHARARDAVHLALDVEALVRSLAEEGFPTIPVASRAAERFEYLRRPDLGRRLAPEFRDRLCEGSADTVHRLTFIVADGLSSLAPARHAAPLLREFRAQLERRKDVWVLDQVVVATQARVAIGDEIGYLRKSEAVVVLIGERPGLSSPDSLGIYLTYAPRVGASDAERNCISNVRPAGLSYPEAASKLYTLLGSVRRAGASGVLVKDTGEQQADLNGALPGHALDPGSAGGSKRTQTADEQAL